MMFMRRMLIENKDLTDVTWFHPGGSARVFFQPAHMADLGEYLRDLPEKTQVEVLGGGSNTCFSSGCFDGVLVYLETRFGVFEALSERTVRERSDRRAAALRNAVIIQAVLELPQQVPEKLNGALADVNRQHEEMFPTAPLYTSHVFSKKIGNADEAGRKSPTEQATQILRRLGKFRLPGTGLYLDRSFPNIIFSGESSDGLRLTEFAQLIANRCRQEFAADLECNLNIVGDLR